jgi:hypothetical protein
MDSLRKRNINQGQSEPIRNVADVRIAKKLDPGLQENNHMVYSEPIINKNEKIKEKSNKKIHALFSIAMFLMVFAFVAIIGWYEFNNSSSNNLEKLLSKNAPPDDKSASPAGKTSTVAPKASQAQVAPENQIAPTNAENISTGTTSPDATSDSEDNTKKTYKNGQGEISFDYTGEYKIEENNGQIMVMKNENNDTLWRMKIYDNKDKKEIQGWFDSYFSGKDNTDCSLGDPATLKIGTLTTKLMKVGATDGKCDGVGYYALSSDKSKVARVRLDKADETEANKILSSFKFIK